MDCNPIPGWIAIRFGQSNPFPALVGLQTTDIRILAVASWQQDARQRSSTLFFFLSRFSSSISPFNHQYSNTNPIINSINSDFSRFFLVSLNDHWTPEAADNPPFLISYLKNDTVKISFIINSIISIRLHFRIHCGCPPSFI